MDSKPVQKLNDKEEKINLDREKLEDSQIKRIILLEAPSKNLFWTRSTATSTLPLNLTTTSTAPTTTLQNITETEAATTTLTTTTTSEKEDNSSNEGQETTLNVAPYASSLVERLALVRNFLIFMMRRMYKTSSEGLAVWALPNFKKWKLKSTKLRKLKKA